MKVRATVTQTLSDRQGETVKTDKHYVGLSHKEIQALGSVSGEAFRLYVAVASFAYGKKTTAFPTWKMIGERMGKKLSPEAGQATAKRLEAAGLLRRGKFGSQNRWTLTLKEGILHPPTEGGESLNGDDGGPSEELSPPPNSYEGINNKRNNRIKDSSIDNKDECLKLERGWVLKTDIIHDVATKNISVLKNSYSRQDRLKMKQWMVKHEDLHHLIHRLNKADS